MTPAASVPRWPSHWPATREGSVYSSSVDKANSETDTGWQSLITAGAVFQPHNDTAPDAQEKVSRGNNLQL